MSTAIDSLVTDLAEEARNRFQRYNELGERMAQMGQKQAARMLRAIILSEKARLGLYRECLGLLHEGSGFAYYVCPQCGLVLAESAPERCLLCETPGDEFIEVG